MGYREERPWGSFENLYEDSQVKIKRITVKPGRRLSLQSHQHRAENWIVISGTAVITLGTREIRLKPNQSVFIPRREKHRLANPADLDLEIIEIQTGEYFGEDDITRYQDDFNRN
jgi:mannose-6-phosphate isomerase-like protein (cupin superfamily)